MIWLELKQMVDMPRMCELVLIGIFCAAVMEVTLETAQGRRIRICKWSIVILAVILIYQLIVSGSGMLDLHFLPQRKESWGNDVLLSLFFNGIYLFCNTLTRLLPTALAYAGGIWLYRQERSAKAFAALLTGLGATFIYCYLYALVKIPFQRGDAKELAFDPPQIWLALLLLGICLGVCFWLYRNFLCRRLKKLMDTPDGRMDGFVKVPFLSAVVFAVQLAVLFTFYMSPDSTDMENRFIFIVVTGCLLFAYILMYWSIFRGIALSTEAMKTRAELSVAANIQVNMLPCIFPAFPERPEFDIYAAMTPAKEVGGDFYDFFLVDSDHLAIVIADVSGKGISAALFMVIAKTLIKDNTQAGTEPAQVFTKVNRQLCEANDEGMFVTAWMGMLEISSGHMLFANAGHNPPLLHQANGTWEYLKQRSGFVLAGMEDIRYKSGELQLNPGDTLYLYTDGVTEATNSTEVLYGETRLQDSLNAAAYETPEQLLTFIKGEVDAFVGEAPQFDDITMLALTFNKGRG